MSAQADRSGTLSHWPFSIGKAALQRLGDRLFQRQRAPGLPRLREGVLAELGAGGSEYATKLSAVEPPGARIDADLPICRTTQTHRSLHLPPCGSQRRQASDAQRLTRKVIDFLKDAQALPK